MPELNDDTVSTTAMGADVRVFGAESAAAATPTSYGRASLYATAVAALANDAATALTNIGLGTSATPEFAGVTLSSGTGLTVGASVPFSDSAGVLTLQNVDALDATTEATIEGAIDTLANLISIQGRTVTLADSGADRLFGWDDSVNAYVNLSAADATATLNVFAGDSGSGGVKGVVPAPAAGDAAAGKYLKADGTWEVPPAGGGGEGPVTGTSATTTTPAVTAKNTADGSAVAALRLEGYSATPASGDQVYTSFYLRDSAGNSDEFARLTVEATDATSTSEDGVMHFSLATAGSLSAKVSLRGDAIFPTVNDGIGLGLASNGFADLHMATGGTFNWANGNAVLTHSSGVLNVTTGDLKVGGSSVITDADVVHVGNYANAQAAADAAHGRLFFIPAGESVTVTVPGQKATIDEALDAVARWVPGPDSLIIISIASGTYTRDMSLTTNGNGEIVIDHPLGNRLQIKAASGYGTLTFSSLGTITNTGAGNHSVEITLSSAATVSVGDWIRITSTTGTGDHYTIRGFWEVTAKASNTITIKVTDRRAAWNATTVSAMTLYRVPVLFKYTNPPGTEFYGIDIRTCLGDAGGITGVAANNGFAAIGLVGPASGLANSGVRVSYGAKLYSASGSLNIANFGRNGVWAFGNSQTYLDQAAITNCSTTGMAFLESANGQIIRSIVSGCSATGISATTGAALSASSVVVCGNDRGFDAANRGGGIEAGTAVIWGNATGFRAQHGGFGSVSGATLGYNTTALKVEVTGGRISAPSVTNTSNTTNADPAVNTKNGDALIYDATGPTTLQISGNDVYRVSGTDVAIADGGTGASTAAAARTNLSVPELETGTWTPTLSFATPGDVALSYTNQVGYYHRIGDWVFLGCRLTVTPTYTTASGAVEISGVPFNSHGTLTIQGGALSGHTAALTYPASRVFPVVRFSSTTKLGLVGFASGQASASIGTSQMASASQQDLFFSLHYRRA